MLFMPFMVIKKTGPDNRARIVSSRKKFPGTVSGTAPKI
jgi:hypothetical protein